MEPIRTLVIDDDPVARQGLCEILSREPDLELLSGVGDGPSAVEAIRQLKPDLVFLDVELPGMTGFDVLRSVNMPVLTIFVTGHNDFALKAFEWRAVDYLLKPFPDRRLQQALTRAREHILNARKLHRINHQISDLLTRMDQPAPQPKYLDRIAVRTGWKVTFLNVESIDWIEAADNYVSIHEGKQVHLLRHTLSEMEKKLDPKLFLRIHRCRIVNVNRVRELRPLSSGDCLVILRDGTQLHSSRTYHTKRHRLFNLH